MLRRSQTKAQTLLSFSRLRDYVTAHVTSILSPQRRKTFASYVAAESNGPVIRPIRTWPCDFAVNYATVTGYRFGGRFKMNDQQKKEQDSGARDREIRAALDQHWAASDANDFETEHRIYHEDAVLEYPQSGERTRGRRNIQNQRASQPSEKRFAVRRTIGSGDLWITEFVLTYDGKPSYTLSIMEFRDDKVTRETQYFADPFAAPASRAQWVERMDT
jgi:hypothetical protein